MVKSKRQAVRGGCFQQRRQASPAITGAGLAGRGADQDAPQDQDRALLLRHRQNKPIGVSMRTLILISRQASNETDRSTETPPPSAGPPVR